MRTGLDVLRDSRFAPLKGRRVGLVCHPASVDSTLRHAAELFAGAPDVDLAALFGPEHGFHGAAQDLMSVGHARAGTRRVHSLYGSTFASLKPAAEALHGLDTLAIDLQDVGTRYYTFQATMLYCLEACAESGVAVVVLDRPNPLGGVDVEGPALAPGFESFVGPHDIATRHGLTIGELARFYRGMLVPRVQLEVIACDGLRRARTFEQTGLPWVLPSPNMPTLDTAVVYPGMCLIEGTNLSEGRGTTRPFELCGAPWISPDELAGKLEAERLPGVRFRPAHFRPTFQKFAGQDCGGVQLHVTDRRAFRSVRSGLAVLAHMRALSGPRFAWRTEAYEFVFDRPAIDLLFGSARERSSLEAGVPWREITRA
ncbi:MAG: exo-beta-N-acetylmuramidase NamZ domain-containing protein [Gemmata sp.]